MSPTDIPLTYVTRDIERALGILPSIHFRIITNKTVFSETLKNQYPDFITLIESHDGKLLATSALLEHPDTAKTLPANAPVIVFKNTARIETIAQEHGWHIINPSASLAEQVENKITQVEWLGDLGDTYLPTHRIEAVKSITWKDEPFILQWAHGHTGGGTLLIEKEAQLIAIQRDFPERPVRKTVVIKGPSFTVNAVVAQNAVHMGNISYQITGLPPFTDSQFTTIGNDWTLSHDLLSDIEINYIETMVHEIGIKLATHGWRGLFGVDVMRDDERGGIKLIEINARQPASTSFESFLQNENRIQGLKGITLFEAHIAALLGQPVTKKLILVNDGAQVIQRITHTPPTINDEMKGSLELLGYHVLTYPNTEYNEDLIRIQSPRGIMQGHTVWNERGKEIIEIITGAKTV
jgi:hypothetical protein